MEHEKIYVFDPEPQRPAKRRRIEPHGLQASWRTRREAYENAWQTQQRRIDERLESLNASTTTELSQFLEENAPASLNGSIPAGIISTGPDATSRNSIFEQLAQIPGPDGKRIFVLITASPGRNLKAVLKTIIQKATAQIGDIGDDDDDNDHTTTKRGSKLLNYDLQILFDYVLDRDVKQVVLAIQDTEAFDSHLLSELIETLGFWSDRIPFVCLLSIATSLDFLQQRLSKQAVKCMQGRLFDAATSVDALEGVFEAVIHPDAPLYIGSGLMRFALERQNDFIQSINCFVEAVNYAYMSCFYANALSIFLNPQVQLKDVPADHYKAIRNLESFQAFCRNLLANNEPTRLKDLLNNDAILFGMVRQKVHEGLYLIAELIKAVDVVRGLQLALANQQAAPRTTLYIQAMAHKLADTSQLRSLLLSIRKAQPASAMACITAVVGLDIRDDLRRRCTKIRKELTELIKSQEDATQPLRSEEDVKNSTLRTTVIAQKVELSKQKSSLSKEDAAYTAILRRFTDLLEEYFAGALIDPTSLVFHEIFLYDLKSPHREVFAPKPRHANERAFSAPHDYLACDCCTPDQAVSDEPSLAACQPATAVLYQLYLESGSLINVSDLWQAFQAVNSDEGTEAQNSALFHRALAELQYLGLVKSTRRRVDHIAKAAWKGL